jgi:glycosyltransferase involved in cell wall biosynthesis
MNERKLLHNITVPFQSSRWQPVTCILRPFVRYPSDEASTGGFWQYSPQNVRVILSVIIPTFDAYRDGYLLKLLAQIESQDFLDFELIVVKGDPRQGRAINIGAAVARGKYLLTLDDDTSLPDPETFSKLVAVMEANPKIGIAGGSNIIPPDAKPLIRLVMKQVPRRSWKLVQTITDSDLAEHPCLIMRKEEFMAVGGENEQMPRGLDPYLREEFRKLGKRIVVVPEVFYHHLPPGSFHKLIRQFYRNGQQAAFCNRKYPQWVIETPENHGPFKARVPFPLRLLRFSIRLLRALVTLKFIWFVCEMVYALGFVYELFIKKEFD